MLTNETLTLLGTGEAYAVKIAIKDEELQLVLNAGSIHKLRAKLAF